MQSEITYDEAAQVLGCSPRHIRTLLAQHKGICPVIRYSYKRVRLKLADVTRLKRTLLDAALQEARAA